MHIIIDRIEDGKMAVIRGIEGGEMLIPTNLFPFPVHEGMHLEVTFHQNPKEENNMRESIEKLRKDLKREENQ